MVDWAAKRHPQVLFQASCADSLVALTIDDGPTEKWTPAILDVLQQHEVRATFFLVGSRVDGNGDLVRRIVDHGHEIGNHMLTVRPSITLSPPEFERHLAATDSLIAPFGPVRWMRPASGWFTDDMRRVVEGHGYRMALGSLYPNDAMNPFPGYHAYYILSYVKPGDVIILHDGLGWRTRAPYTLRRILPVLKSRGYAVVTLSELVTACNG